MSDIIDMLDHDPTEWALYCLGRARRDYEAIRLDIVAQQREVDALCRDVLNVVLANAHALKPGERKAVEKVGHKLATLRHKLEQRTAELANWFEENGRYLDETLNAFGTAGQTIH
jgi:hypothetical protein